MSKKIEIPQGKRTAFYRAFEILPAFLSYGALFLMLVLSIFWPYLASIYLLLITVVLLYRAVGTALRTVAGYAKMSAGLKVNWQKRLEEFENPSQALKKYESLPARYQDSYAYQKHFDALRLAASQEDFLKPSQVYNAIIVTAYKESYQLIRSTMEVLTKGTFPKEQTLIFFAYEERGGADIEETAQRLKAEFGQHFADFLLVKHPQDIPGEIVGKGGNITHAGKAVEVYCQEKNIPVQHVLVTTLDCDNKPHKKYFSAASYEFLTRPDRKHHSYQPVSLFFNNIWDAPAPMRLIAMGNSFWNLVISMRPRLLRNFASHSQPLEALVEMDFWSVRTIVEDGHQFWRSYFHFDGNYSVVPVSVPIYQDAVLSETLGKTLKAQFIQLRRWNYGASDVPYVAQGVFSKDRTVPFWDGFFKFMRLLEGHVSLAYQPILIASGAWLPLVLNEQFPDGILVENLPIIIGLIQQFASLGILVSIIVSLMMLPPRPGRYALHRTLFMILQWFLLPVTSICYNSLSAFYSQTCLALGKYLDKYEVTQKSTLQDVERAKQLRKQAVATK